MVDNTDKKKEKRTQSARNVRPLVESMYLRAYQARERGQKVAYCMVMSQYDEILAAMDIVPVWTENYGGLCAALGTAQPFLEKAESEGYSNLICGYARTGIGFDALRAESGEAPQTPDGGMPMPDMLLGSSIGCDTRFKWYQALDHYMDVPIYCIDVIVPPVDRDLYEIKDFYVKYQAEQLRGLVKFLEKTTGCRLDHDRLMSIIHRAEEARHWWWEAQQLCRAIPAPMSARDHFNIFVPHHFMIGEEATLDFYKELYQELKDRVDSGIGVVDNERYRLLFAGGLPPWHSMGIFSYFGSLGAVFPAQLAYPPPDPFTIPDNINDPIELMALRSFERFTYRWEQAHRGCGDFWVQHILDLIPEFNIDGLVMHGVMSCRATSMGQIYYQHAVQKYAKLRTLFIGSDIVDIRTYSEAQTKIQIDIFLETVETLKSNKESN